MKIYEAIAKAVKILEENKLIRNAKIFNFYIIIIIILILIYSYF